MICHACASPAEDRGPYGWLCSSCWRRVLAVLERILGRPSRWTESRLPYATPIDGSTPACIYPPNGLTAREILDRARRPS